MAETKIEPLQLRAWAYERLRRGKTGSLELQISDIGLHVRQKAIHAVFWILALSRPTMPSLISSRTLSENCFGN